MDDKHLLVHHKHAAHSRCECQGDINRGSEAATRMPFGGYILKIYPVSTNTGSPHAVLLDIDVRQNYSSTVDLH